jgi:hypothetical protein
VQSHDENFGFAQSCGFVEVLPSFHHSYLYNLTHRFLETKIHRNINAIPFVSLMNLLTNALFLCDILYSLQDANFRERTVFIFRSVIALVVMLFAGRFFATFSWFGKFSTLAHIGF